MKTFTIDSDNSITVYATRKAASDAKTGVVFSSEDDLSALLVADGKRLVAIYNSLTGVTPVRKFTSNAVASKRIHAELAKLQTPIDALPNESKAPKATHAKVAREKAAKPAREAVSRKEPGASKKEQVLALIGRKSGATIDEIMTATGWQKHTVRGFIAILGKKGTKIDSTKSEAGARTYTVA